jgi:hypothetical protein
MDLQQLEQKRLQLQGEITLLERQLEKLQQDLAQLDETKKSETKLHLDKIDKLKKNINILIVDKESLEKNVKSLSEEYKTVTTNLEEYGKNEVKKTEEAVKSIYLEADNVNKKAQDHAAEVKKNELEISVRESNVNKLIQEVKIQTDKNIFEKCRLQAESKLIEQLRIDTNEMVSAVEKKVYNLNAQIKSLEAKAHGLEITVQIKEKWAKQTDEEINTKKIETERLLAESKAINEAADKRENELIEREKLLKDQQSMLQRSINEFENKGGILNG